MAVNRKSKNEDCVLNQSTLEYANTFILFVSYGIFLNIGRSKVEMVWLEIVSNFENFLQKFLNQTPMHQRASHSNNKM